MAASPHIYRAEGLEKGRPPAVLDAAISQAAKAEASGVPPILTLRHLAFRTGIEYKYLRSVIANTDGSHYREYSITKRSGGRRRIMVPEPRLMALQRWIVREILRGRSAHDSSFAYSRESSIRKCAERHAGAGWLLKLDIHDFFESIPERSVYRVFRELGYQPLVAFELARLCTRPWVAPPSARADERRVKGFWRRGIDVYRRRYTGYLPQGAPTSPMLSNLVCRRLDQELASYADAKGITYTRYSDDITFSGPPGSFCRTEVLSIIGEVRVILAWRGLRLHENKISVVPPGARKVVLGLLVDGGAPRLSREVRQRISDHVRGIELFGLLLHKEHRKFDSVAGMVAHIGGLLRFARHIEPQFADPLRKRLDDALVAQGWSPRS